MSEDPVAVLRRARQQAIEISDKASGRALYRVLKEAEDDLAYRLERHRQLRPMGDGSFTRNQMEVTLRQIRTVMRTVVDRLGIAIPDASEDAARAGSDGTLEYLNAAEARFTGINAPLALDEAALSDAAIAGTKASVARRLMVEHPDGRGGGILQRYGFEVTRRFERELSVGVMTRKPFDEIKASLVEQSPFLQGAPRSWAERLTRTELLGAYSRGGHASMQKAQEELGDMVRILVATFDNRTGCLLGSTPLTGAVVRAIFRRRYEGHVLRVRTEAGRDLTTTPKHPMLSRSGWLATERLRVGDELVCYLGDENASTSREQDVADRPASLVEVFETLAVRGCIERRGTCQEDFHGDGMNGEVDVLRLDGPLRFGRFATIGEPIAEKVFTPSDDVHFCSACGALLGAGACRELNRARSSPKRDTGLFQATGDERLRVTIGSPDAFDRLTGGVSFRNGLDGHLLSVFRMLEEEELVLRGLGARSHQTARTNFLEEEAAMRREGCGHSCHAHPREIEFDRVVDIEVRAFRGHVFNLQTEDGYFTIDGAYTGNCDSWNVHGQIRRMDEPFEYVAYDGEHQFFMTPPNRPNDREVVVAHRLSWPIPPAFRPKSDGEVEARYAKMRQTYHGRPHKMSTVRLPAAKGI